MLKSEVRSAIFDAVAAMVKPLGFKSKKTEFSLTRKFEGGFQRIVFPTVDYAPKILITPLVAARLDVLDDLANKFDTRIVPEARSRQTSIQILPNYFAGQPKEYSISTAQELVDKTAEMLDVLEKNMLPFIERCTEVSFIEKALSSESGSRLNPDPLSRELNIIAAASICGLPDIVTLGAKSRTRLEFRNVGAELQIFDQTLQHILKGSFA